MIGPAMPPFFCLGTPPPRLHYRVFSPWMIPEPESARCHLRSSGPFANRNTHFARGVVNPDGSAAALQVSSNWMGCGVPAGPAGDLQIIAGGFCLRHLAVRFNGLGTDLRPHSC